MYSLITILFAFFGSLAPIELINDDHAYNVNFGGIKALTQQVYFRLLENKHPFNISWRYDDIQEGGHTEYHDGSVVQVKYSYVKDLLKVNYYLESDYGIMEYSFTCREKMSKREENMFKSICHYHLITVFNPGEWLQDDWWAQTYDYPVQRIR